MKVQSTIKAKVLYILGALIGIAGLQLLFSGFPAFRSFYIHHFYPKWAALLRGITGWFPFSFGDILYLLVGLWFVFGCVAFVKMLIKRKQYPRRWIKILLQFVQILLTLYFVFLLFWGLNYRYNRIDETFEISGQKNYSPQDIKVLCDTLAGKLNVLHFAVNGSDSLPLEESFNFSDIKQEVFRAYRRMGYETHALRYYMKSLKPSMFGQLMNYSGVTGYYNPFTGEAQVNTTPPKVEIPFTTCHEVAHQLGFAPEEDANFIGFYVAARSKNKLFQYSAYFSLFLYAMNALPSEERAWADTLWEKKLNEGVKKDYENYFTFFLEFKTPFKEISNRAYDQYLKANEQLEGIKSYDGIVALVLDYQKKYGSLP